MRVPSQFVYPGRHPAAHPRTPGPAAHPTPDRQRAVWAKAVAESAGQPAESGGGGELTENCRRLHRYRFAPKSRADQLLAPYVALIRTTRPYSWAANRLKRG